MFRLFKYNLRTKNIYPSSNLSYFYASEDCSACGRWIDIGKCRDSKTGTHQWRSTRVCDKSSCEEFRCVAGECFLLFNHPPQHHPQLKKIYTCILKAPAINKSFVSLICFKLPPSRLFISLSEISRTHTHTHKHTHTDLLRLL